jgi:3-oxoacyl-[acyl-carrier protein] reductase
MSLTQQGKTLHQQVAIVTGGARGIGVACAYALAGAGAHVVIVDVLPAEEAKQRITEAFPDVDVVTETGDVRERDQVKAIIERAIQRWGRIDVLVNNAGTCSRLNLETMTDEQWDRDLDTNLRGAFLFTQLCVYPHMKERGYGKIVNISSISGMNGGLVSNTPGSDAGRSGPAYAASKGGVIAFTKWVAKELGSYGIYCNSIAPGSVKTEITKGMDYPLDQQPIKRMGEPEDISDAVVFLATPSSNYITGQILRVCGGVVIS